MYYKVIFPRKRKANKGKNYSTTQALIYNASQGLFNSNEIATLLILCMFGFYFKKSIIRKLSFVSLCYNNYLYMFY